MMGHSHHHSNCSAHQGPGHDGSVDHLSHDHLATAGANSRRLVATLVLAAAYMVAEVVGGLLTGSLALLADAGHMLSDVGALAFSVLAIRIAQRPSNLRKTYGYHRAEVLAAFINAATLVGISLTIIIEAVRRLREPIEVQGAPMLAVAVGGLLVNLAGLWILSGGKDQSLNLKGAWLHVLTDALGSVQAIVAGLLIWRLGWTWTDPVASILIGLLVAYSGWSLLREATNVLMEAAPGHLDVAEIEAQIRALLGVREVHDLHVWTITSGFVALSTHVIAVPGAPADLLWRIRDLLQQRFSIEHTTIQIEPGVSVAGEPPVLSLPLVE